MLGVDPRKIKPDQYVLMRAEQDRQAAHRWNVLNEVRKKKASVKDKIIDYFRKNVGEEPQARNSNISPRTRRSGRAVSANCGPRKAGPLRPKTAAVKTLPSVFMFLKKTGRRTNTTAPSPTPFVSRFFSATVSNASNAAGTARCYRGTIPGRCWSFITDSITRTGEKTRSRISKRFATCITTIFTDETNEFWGLAGECATGCQEPLSSAIQKCFALPAYPARLLSGILPRFERSFSFRRLPCFPQHPAQELQDRGVARPKFSLRISAPATRRAARSSS